MKKFNLLLGVVLTIMLIGSISALDLGFNHKKYLEQNSTNGVIEIKNFWGLGSRVAEYTLTDYGSSVVDVWAQGTVSIYGNRPLFDGVNFKDTLGNLKTLKDVNFYIWTNESFIVDVPDYKTVCTQPDVNMSQDCNEVMSGTHPETRYRELWKPYNRGDKLTEGNYTWKLEASRKPNQNIDFILLAQGKSLDEWAWWNDTWGAKQQITGLDPARVQHFNITYSPNMNSNFSDLRFTDSAESTELSYYIRKKQDGIFAEVDVQTLGDTSVYMYYKNSAAASSSNLNSIYDYGGLPTSLWFLDDGDGTDATGLNNLSTIGSLTYTAGNISNASIGGGANYLNGSTTGFSTSTVTYVVRFKKSTAGTGMTWLGNDYAPGGFAGARITYDNTNIYYQVSDSGYGPNVAYAWASDSNFHTIVGVYGETANAIQGYFDGVSVGNSSWDGRSLIESTIFRVFNSPAASFSGTYTEDEVMVFNRSLNASAVNFFTNITEPSASFGAETLNLGAVLNSPVDYYNTTSNTVNFNATAAAGGNPLVNVSFILDDAYNDTNTSGIAGDYLYTLIIADGTHTWNLEACDSANKCANGTARTFTIDSINPVNTIITPVVNQLVTALPANVSLNDSVTDSHLSTCWYYTSDSATNITYTCNTLTNVSFSTAGNKTIYVFANDTFGNEDTNSTTFLLNLINENVNYSTQAIETNTTDITLNLTATSITSFNATLIWNGTTYNSTFSNNATLGLANTTITVPPVNADQNVTFYFTYYLDGVAYNTSTYQQTVLTLNDIVVSSTPCTNLSLNYSFKDEANLTNLTADVQYNFIYGTAANSSLKNIYGSFTAVDNVYFCINASKGNYTVSYGEIDYSASGYSDRRYYLFNGTILTSEVNNITLYDLATADQTSFKLEVEDSSLNPYVNKYTALVRWYPDLNQYNIVDMGLTDETGSTVIHVRTEDVDYRIGVYEQNGTLIKLASPVRMVCLVTPCTYTLKITPTDTDYTSFLNIQGSLTYNDTTEIWTYSYVDTSQKTTTMNLTVYKLTGTTIYAVCSSEVTGYTGAVNCNSSGYSGTLRGVVLRSASPPVVIAEKIIDTTTSAFRSTFGLWLSFIIGVPIAFIFAVMSPIAAILGGVLALIPALYFKTINWAILGGIAILAGIVIHFLKRVK